MTNSLNSSNQIPAYSGITINITNPTLNPGSVHHSYPNGCQNNSCNICQSKNLNSTNDTTKSNISVDKNSDVKDSVKDNATNSSNPMFQIGNSYPAEYYLNNYNIQNPVPNNNSNNIKEPIQDSETSQNASLDSKQDLETSEKIIQDIDTKINEQKELEKNSKKTKVVALTNEYIMSLENYLNNPNKDLRIMASKEILTRLDEDRDRFNDAALNALLNKMLQDPEELVRTAAMSAFASELASGNDYTIELLTKMQQNPNSSKDDILTASKILLKMSTTSETKYVSLPIQVEVPTQQVEKQ